MVDGTGSVAVLWANPEASNLGVRALAEGSAELARRAIGDRVRVEFPVFEDEPLRSTLSTASLLRGLASTAGALREYLAGFDVLIEAGGGDSFTDIYGLPRLARMAHIHRAARSARIPVVFGPQTIGPFETRLGRLLGRRMLRSADLVLARDSTSAEHAKSLGRVPDALATDVVFLLPAPQSAPARDIVLNVSGLLWDGNAHVDAAAYRATVRSFIRGALASGRDVTLLPHVLDNPSPDNDVPAARALARELGSGVDVVVPTSLIDARSVIASASVVVGARMHACLNALSTGVPAVPWAYSRKFLPLMRDLGWSAGFDLRTDSAVAERTLELVDSMRGSGTDVDAVRQRAGARLATAVDALRAGRLRSAG